MGHQQVTQDADTRRATEDFFLIPKKIRSKIDPVVKIGVSAVERCLACEAERSELCRPLIGLASEAALHGLRPLAVSPFPRY
jgi:hypothetical protein